MTLEKNEYTTQQFLTYLRKKYGGKTTGEPFNYSDIAQYIIRGRIPYKYGGQRIAAKKHSGIRVITVLGKE